MNEQTDAFGKLILRLYLGLALLGHGIPKILHGISGITNEVVDDGVPAWQEILQGLGGVTDAVVSHGLPAWVAYGVYAGEVLGPVLVILGLFCRVGAGLIVVSMLFAIGLVHIQEVLTLSEHGSWALELQGFFLFTALAVGLLGSGRYALKPD